LGFFFFNGWMKRDIGYVSIHEHKLKYITADNDIHEKKSLEIFCLQRCNFHWYENKLNYKKRRSLRHAILP
jgi:hypothetical protein